MYVSRTLSVYECRTVYTPDGMKAIGEEKLHVIYDGFNQLHVTRDSSRDGTSISANITRYAVLSFWTLCKDCHAAFVAVAAGWMMYAVFADFLEERKASGIVREDKPGDWDYVVGELRRWAN